VQWAMNPTGIPGFVVQSSPGVPLTAYYAGTIRFRIRYSHTVASAPVVDSVDTQVTQDFYLHSPVSPAPSGADTSLVLGNLFKTETAIHFPLDSIPSGVSVDEATLVLNLLPSSAAPDSLPPRTFRWVPGDGLYANAGGGSPADHQAKVGHRASGFIASGRAGLVIDGFTVTRADDRGICLLGGCENVTITDNGEGFDGDETAAGQGLKNMRARAESIEGGFSLRSTPGRGTALEVVLRT